MRLIATKSHILICYKSTLNEYFSSFIILNMGMDTYGCCMFFIIIETIVNIDRAWRPDMFQMLYMFFRELVCVY